MCTAVSRWFLSHMYIYIYTYTYISAGNMRHITGGILGQNMVSIPLITKWEP